MDPIVHSRVEYLSQVILSHLQYEYFRSDGRGKTGWVFEMNSNFACMERGALTLAPWIHSGFISAGLFIEYISTNQIPSTFSHEQIFASCLKKLTSHDPPQKKQISV